MKRAMILCSLLLVISCREKDVEPVTADSSAVSTAARPAAVTTSGSPVPSSAIPGNVIEVRIVDDHFEMANQIPAGSTTFRIRNDGEHEHNFEIEGQGIEKDLPEPLKTGGTGDLTVELGPGRYRVYCPVGNHVAEHGMETWVTVI